MSTGEGWRPRAACRGLPVSMFYPGRGDRRGRDLALAVCRQCEVAEECLAEALAGAELGVWGGTDSDSRRRSRRLLRAR
ncbi:MAG: WhiB family transcriptional regulator [Acidimicrobiales bacterium]